MYLPYDSKFVYAEVNGDKVYWLVKEENGSRKYVKLNVESQSIGANISTKAVGQNRREDITQQYKFPEGDCPHPPKQCRGGPWLRGSPHNASAVSNPPHQGWRAREAALLPGIFMAAVTSIGCSLGTGAGKPAGLWERGAE